MNYLSYREDYLILNKLITIYCNKCNEEMVIFERDKHDTFYCYKCGNKTVTHLLPNELFEMGE